MTNQREFVDHPIEQSTSCSWPSLVEILTSEECEDERARTTLFLRRLMKVGFMQLRDALEDLSRNTTWANPSLIVRIVYPPESVKEVQFDEVEPQMHATPEARELAMHMDLLTAGACTFVADGRRSAALPESVAEAVAGVPPEKHIEVFDKWLNIEEWVAPISFGDTRDSEGSLKQATIVGLDSNTGSKIQFRANLCFFIFPREINCDNKESYHDLVIELPWSGESSPDSWSQSEREALWATIFQLVDELIGEVHEGKVRRQGFKVKVKANAPARIGAFVALLDNKKRKAISESARVRMISEGSLRGFPRRALGVRGPALDILDKNGMVSPSATIEIFAAMLYPDDSRRREKYSSFLRAYMPANQVPDSVLSRQTQFHLESPEERNWYLETIPHSFVSVGATQTDHTTNEMRRTFKRLRKEVTHRMRGGASAGSMFLDILIAADSCPQHASVNKAVYLCVEDFKRAEASRGRKVRRRRSWVFNEWKRLKPVAHLWAALQIGLEAEEVFRAQLVPGEELAFLALAERLRFLGETTFARAQESTGGPILDPSETWRAPDGLALPEVDFVIPGVDDVTMRLLAGYHV